MSDQEKEERQLIKRWEELAHKSQYNGQFTFTGFLSMAELDSLYRCMERLGFRDYETFGGRPGCERRMARFGSPLELGYTEEFPIVCIQVRPALEKFAEELNHRDFLGAVMNLGIDRSTTGDIFIKDKSGFIFCNNTIAPYIMENLEQVRHTHMKCSVCEDSWEYEEKEPERSQLLVSSPRIDGILSKVYPLSRSQSLELFRAKKVFVNGRVYENNSGILKDGDTVSVRGYGKFVFYGTVDETKKGKFRISVGIYR